jgi:hypothetical protein
VNGSTRRRRSEQHTAGRRRALALGGIVRVFSCSVVLPQGEDLTYRSPTQAARAARTRQSERPGAEGEDGEFGAMSVTAEPAAGYGSGDKDKQRTHPCLPGAKVRLASSLAPGAPSFGRGRRWLEPERELAGGGSHSRVWPLQHRRATTPSCASLMMTPLSSDAVCRLPSGQGIGPRAPKSAPKCRSPVPSTAGRRLGRRRVPSTESSFALALAPREPALGIS